MKEEKKGASLASIAAVCNKLKKKIRDLAKMGKVSLSTPESGNNGGCPKTPAEKKKGKHPAAEKNILDLNEGYFSGGSCKNTAAGTHVLCMLNIKKHLFLFTELMYAENSDEEDMNNDETIEISENGRTQSIECL